jgi:hypothetical protein
MWRKISQTRMRGTGPVQCVMPRENPGRAFREPPGPLEPPGSFAEFVRDDAARFA